MRVAELRCTAEHPRASGRECRAKLGDIMVHAVSVVRVYADVVRMEGLPLRCHRCGALYVVLARPAVPKRQAG